MAKWFDETLYPFYRQAIRIDETLYRGKTAFQKVEFHRNERLGRFLTLDGVIQTTEGDEFYYHEGMVHAAMLAHGKAKSVLIIGGADGGILREVLKYKSVKQAVLVDIDGELIDLCRQYVPSINGGAFEDPRTVNSPGDGAAYVANDGGLKFTPLPDGRWAPGGTSDNYVGGSIQRVDLKTGTSRILYKAANGNPLSAPNDLVFDNSGGIWVSDAGATKGRQRDLGGIYWCKADGSEIREVVFPLLTPNGITMSPDKKTLYLAMTAQRQILSFQVEAPGVLKKGADGKPEQTVFASIGGLSSFDSMTMEADGTLVAASPQLGLIKVFRPNGEMRDEISFGVNGLTNVTFGGADWKTLYITLTRTGQLVSIPWPRPGLKPANQ